MGSSMKTTIFNEQVGTALKEWHRTAKKNAKASKHNHGDGTSSHVSSRPTTPLRDTSPIHLLQNFNRVSHLADSPQASPYRASDVRNGDRYDDLDSQFQHPHNVSDIKEQEEPPRPVALDRDSERPPSVPPQEESDREEADISFSDYSVRR